MREKASNGFIVSTIGYYNYVGYWICYSVSRYRANFTDLPKEKAKYPTIVMEKLAKYSCCDSMIYIYKFHHSIL